MIFFGPVQAKINRPFLYCPTVPDFLDRKIQIWRTFYLHHCRNFVYNSFIQGGEKRCQTA